MAITTWHYCYRNGYYLLLSIISFLTIIAKCVNISKLYPKFCQFYLILINFGQLIYAQNVYRMRKNLFPHHKALSQYAPIYCQALAEFTVLRCKRKKSKSLHSLYSYQDKKQITWILSLPFPPVGGLKGGILLYVIFISKPNRFLFPLATAPPKLARG